MIVISDKEKSPKFVYAAQGDGYVKVGVTNNVENRQVSIHRDHPGWNFKMLFAWEHKAPFTIEAMVQEVFDHEDAVVRGREVFAVTMDDLVTEVRAAIGRYDRLGLTPDAKPHKSKLRSMRVDDNLARGIRSFYRQPPLGCAIYMFERSKLTPEVRAEFERRYRAGDSIPEIALAMKISEPTFRRYYSRVMLERIRTRRGK